MQYVCNDLTTIQIGAGQCDFRISVAFVGDEYLFLFDEFETVVF